ncbi:hypothetical protein [Allocoleopsis sp.]|uniref:hypothetical protein n=1 Tax=Allocoleopsis sp. TaxID=3088169 RepID=UPI002FD2B704
MPEGRRHPNHFPPFHDSANIDSVREIIMRQTLTAKLKVEVTQEQKEQLRLTCLAYRDALNYTSGVAFEMGKTYNGTKIQKEVYYTLREKFNLPSQMACNVPTLVPR